MERIVVFLMIAALFSGPVSATIIHVPEQYSTIQAGINASVNGDTVLVGPGVYQENININGRNLSLCSNFILARDSTFISNTIIDGGSANSVISIQSGEKASTQIVGFTIRNGLAPFSGGGIHIDHSSHPLIRNNIILSNLAYAVGGGISVYM